MTAHPRAATLFLIADPQWRRKVLVGGLILLIPLVGWPTVLGYRRELVRHLQEDRPEPLPPWGPMFWRHLLDGLKAVGVVFGYLLPLYAATGAILVGRGFQPSERTVWFALFFVGFPVFSTLSLPIAWVLLATSGDAWLRPSDLAFLGTALVATVFLIPAGFLRVSRTGRYASAFALHRTLPFVARSLRAYARAWWHSGWISLFGHLAVPFSPWGVVWAYCAIVFLFNEILHADGSHPSRGWLARTLADPRLEQRGARRVRVLSDGNGELVHVLDVGAFSVPLPRVLCRP